MFVRIPADERATRVAEQLTAQPATLADLDVAVSTGRVVDFRVKDLLRQEPDAGTAALIYPGHIRDGQIDWPSPASKKPNAVHRCRATDALVLPNETYVVVKRFTAKEARRRVVAAVSRAGSLPGHEVAFENHLNVYHRAQRGVPLALALGLSAYLNCTVVDDYVRSFSGHTQINATDLRQLRYPSLDDLHELGEALAARGWPTQDELDALLGRYLPLDSEPIPEAA